MGKTREWTINVVTNRVSADLSEAERAEAGPRCTGGSTPLHRQQGSSLAGLSRTTPRPLLKPDQCEFFQCCGRDAGGPTGGTVRSFELAATGDAASGPSSGASVEFERVTKNYGNLVTVQDI